MQYRSSVEIDQGVLTFEDDILDFGLVYVDKMGPGSTATFSTLSKNIRIAPDSTNWTLVLDMNDSKKFSINEYNTIDVQAKKNKNGMVKIYLPPGTSPENVEVTMEIGTTISMMRINKFRLRLDGVDHLAIVGEGGYYLKQLTKGTPNGADLLLSSSSGVIRVDGGIDTLTAPVVIQNCEKCVIPKGSLAHVFLFGGHGVLDVLDNEKKTWLDITNDF